MTKIMKKMKTKKIKNRINDQGTTIWNVFPGFGIGGGGGSLLKKCIYFLPPLLFGNVVITLIP